MLDPISHPLTGQGAREAGVFPHRIDYSAQFDGAGDDLTLTPVTEDNRKTFTLSMWVKLSSIASEMIFSRSELNSLMQQFELRRLTTGEMHLLDEIDGNTHFIQTEPVFVDCTNHIHVLLVRDSTQAIAEERVKLFVNGERLAYSMAQYPPQNADSCFMTATEPSYLFSNRSTGRFFDGYASRVEYIPGLALTPEMFGKFSAQVDGLWIPKGYSGSYGTNGFRLDFSDAGNLGADASGNGNHWTVGGAPVQTSDTPTNNHCVLQPYVLGDLQGNVTLSNGNLTQTCSATSDDRTTGTIGFSEGKYYWEIEYTTVTAAQNFVGVYGFAWNSDGTLTNDGPIAGFASGDLLGLAVDRDICEVELFKNGVSQGVFPFTPLEGPSRPIQGNQPHTLTANFGATPFAYAPPVGFKPLCAANLEEPAHRAPGDGVGTLVREGTGVQTTVSGLAARPDLVFMKRLDADGTWMLFDTVRGAGRSIATNSNGAEAYPTNGIREFFKDGYTVGDGSNDNALGGQYLDFFLQRGPEFGFDIVTWVGDGVSGRQLAHDCGGTPEFIMVKALTSTNGWVAYHKALGATHFIQPHQVGTAVANSEIWGDVEPNSLAFTVGNNSTVNAPAETYIAYVFRSVPGFSGVFSFEGNGSSAGPKGDLDFLPLAMLGKNVTATQDWFFVSSNMDGGRNNIERWVEGNTVEQAFGSPGLFSFLSGGFKVINSSSLINGNADTILGIAWAAQPFKYSNAF